MAVPGSSAASVSESLRFNALSVVFILRQWITSSSQVPLHHFPFRSPYPSWHAVHQSTTSVLPRRKILECLLQKGHMKEDLMAIQTAYHIARGDTNVDQIILEASRSRAPRHLPVHAARNFDIVMQRLRDCSFLELNGVWCYPFVILTEDFPCSVDGFCDRSHLVHHKVPCFFDLCQPRLWCVREVWTS